MKTLLAILLLCSAACAQPPQDGLGDMPPLPHGNGSNLLPYGFWDRSGVDPDPPVAMSSTRIVWGDERDETDLPPAIGVWEELAEALEADNPREFWGCVRRAWRAACEPDGAH